jgi:NAD(P)H-nitrite reductase large subunit
MNVYFSRPRQLPIPGADFDNVCLLRTPDDANKIAEAAKGKKVVIIGSSFIGMYYSTILKIRYFHCLFYIS